MGAEVPGCGLVDGKQSLYAALVVQVQVPMSTGLLCAQNRGS